MIPNTAPIFIPKDIIEKCEVAARASDEQVLACEYAVGIDLPLNAPILIRSKYGSGNLLLYAFNSRCRFRRESTFKLFV